MITASPEWFAATKKATPRPSSWDEVVGNARAVSVIRETVAAAKIEGRAPAHMLLYGFPGAGKSTMAKLAAKEVGAEFIETTATTLTSEEAVLRLLWEHAGLSEGKDVLPVIFLDEVHVLGNGSKTGSKSLDVESIFTLMEDWVFHHGLAGKTIADKGGKSYKVLTSSLPMFPFCLIGATTEPGMLVQPLLRRFLVHVELLPYTEPEIAKIIEGSARRKGWEIEPAAAVEIAKVSRLSPGVSYQMLTRVYHRAAVRRSSITLDIANEAISDMGLMPLGLNPTDIKLMDVLAENVKGIGQDNLCKTIGISSSQFLEMHEPYMRQLRFIETSNKRSLTPRGLAYLAMIGHVDTTRPDVQAAIAKFGAQLQAA